VESALESRSTDGKAGFVGTEARLGEHAGRKREGVGEGGGATAEIAFRVHGFSPAGHLGEVGAGLLECGHSERERRCGDVDGVQFDDGLAEGGTGKNKCREKQTA
jgi:hypothetical protein